MTKTTKTRLRVAAALSTAMMLAPVALSVVQTQATDGVRSGISTKAVTKEDFEKELAKLTQEIADAVATSTESAFKLTSWDVQLAHDNAINAAKNEESSLKKDAGTAGFKYSALKTRATAAIGALKEVTDATKTAYSSKTSGIAKQAHYTKLQEAKAAYAALTTAQQQLATGQLLHHAIESAEDAYPNTTPVIAATHIRNLTNAIAALPGGLGAQKTQLVKGVADLKSKLANAPKFLTETWQVKALQPVINDVEKAINNGSITTPTLAQLYLDKITAAKDNYDRLITRSVKFTGVGTIDYHPKYGIQVWTIGGKMVMEDNNKNKAKKLNGGTRWKIFGDIINLNGSKMYNLGGDQFIDASYVKFKAN